MRKESVRTGIVDHKLLVNFVDAAVGDLVAILSVAAPQPATLASMSDAGLRSVGRRPS